MSYTAAAGSGTAEKSRTQRILDEWGGMIIIRVPLHGPFWATPALLGSSAHCCSNSIHTEMISMNFELHTIWHAIGWDKFLPVEELGSRRLTIQFLCTHREVSDGITFHILGQEHHIL